MNREPRQRLVERHDRGVIRHASSLYGASLERIPLSVYLPETGNADIVLLASTEGRGFEVKAVPQGFGNISRPLGGNQQKDHRSQARADHPLIGLVRWHGDSQKVDHGSIQIACVRHLAGEFLAGITGKRRSGCPVSEDLNAQQLQAVGEEISDVEFIHEALPAIHLYRSRSQRNLKGDLRRQSQVWARAGFLRRRSAGQEKQRRAKR